jgi:peptide/nickel transport system ATP-binding protein/oligopeptide transport system ATP-binding protein
MTDLLSIRDLSIDFGAIKVVDSISLDIRAGEMLGIVGESGSGKSITMRALLQLLPSPAAPSGRALWRGQNLLKMSEADIRKVRGREIAMIFQEPMTALNPVLSIGLQITESLDAHLGLRGAAARKRAVELLDLVGIPDAKRRLRNYPHEFSGGMRQRAMIAIALAAEPRLLLADEPTTALDVTIQDQILKLLLRLKDELNMSVVLVTHDLETGPVYDVFRNPAHAYTLGLMRSVPARAHARQPLPSIRGTPPDFRQMPPGCRFAPRCDFAIADCSRASPPVRAIEPGHETFCLRADEVSQTVRDVA